MFGRVSSVMIRSMAGQEDWPAGGQDDCPSLFQSEVAGSRTVSSKGQAVPGWWVVGGALNY